MQHYSSEGHQIAIDLQGWVFIPCQAMWFNWMEGVSRYVITPEMSYSDILVPTLDTVRSAYVMDVLLRVHKPVSVYLLFQHYYKPIICEDIGRPNFSIFAVSD